MKILNIFSFLILTILTVSCTKDPLSPEYIVPFKLEYENTPVKADHLQHFGYYWSSGLDIINGTQVNYTEEVSNHVNVVWMAGDFISQLKLAKSFNKKAVLELATMGFSIANGAFIPIPIDEFRTKFSNLWSKVVSEKLEDTVLMIYQLDEPFIKFGSKPIEEVLEIFQQQNEVIRSIAKNKPIGVTMVNEDIDNPKIKIDAFDWVSYDCYTSLYDCRGRSILSLFSLLQEKMTRPDQRMFVIPQTFLWMSDRDPGYENDFNHRLAMYYQMSLSDPTIIAQFPFLWKSVENDGSGNKLKGARELTTMLPVLKDYGMQTLNRSFKMPKIQFGDMYVPYGKMTNQGSKSSPNYVNYNTGLVSGWAIDQDLPHLPTKIKVFIDDDYVGEFSANQFDRDVNKNPEVRTIGSHRFEFHLRPNSTKGANVITNPFKYADGKPHLLYIYAVNYNTGDETCARRECYGDGYNSQKASTNNYTSKSPPIGSRKSHQGRLAPRDVLLDNAPMVFTL